MARQRRPRFDRPPGKRRQSETDELYDRLTITEKRTFNNQVIEKLVRRQLTIDEDLLDDLIAIVGEIDDTGTGTGSGSGLGSGSGSEEPI